MSSTADLAEYLLETAPEQEGWSIVESPHSAGRFNDLLQWASQMTIQDWLLECRVRKRYLGLVLLWLECEVARRHGSEGALWPVLSDKTVVPWESWVYSELFTGSKKPTPKHRDLLQYAAKRFSLRHTFEEEDGQNWYRLICLQIGFTQDDAKVRLASWLSGTPPFSVQRLMEAKDAGAQSFQLLWRSLRMFRLGNLSVDILKDRLASNSWVLPEWRDDLITAARRSSAQFMGAADFEATELGFFTAPNLNITADGRPFFTISLCNLGEIGLESAEYHLRTGHQILARLIRQPDGSYFSDAAEEIALPMQPTVELSIISLDEKIAAHDEAVLWNSIEEVTLYSSRTGKLIPAGERVRAGAGIFIITSEDVTVRPEPTESFELKMGYLLHRINQGWAGQLEALLDVDIVWSSSVVQRPPEQDRIFAEFTQTLDLRSAILADRDPPWELPIQLRIPKGWQFSRLLWRRADGFLVQLDQVPRHLTLVEADAVRPLVLRVRITDGIRYRTCPVSVRVPFVAVLKWDEKGTPHRHQADSILVLGKANRFTWSFNLPPNQGQTQNSREFSFAEGTRLLGRLKSRPSILPDLAGYGAPLHILEDPYQSDKVVMTVANCVIDGGLLGTIKWSESEGGYRINSGLTELSVDHCIHVWLSTDGEGSIVQQIPHAQLEPRAGGWLWPCGEGIRLHALALTFRRTCLGSWFNHASWSNAAVQNPPGSVQDAAALLRSWKAPILREDGGHFGKIADWVSRNWVQILPVWLAQGASQGLNVQEWDMDVRNQIIWFTVVGDILNAASPIPTAEEAEAFISVLAPNTHGENALGEAVWKLVDVCPLLTARLVRTYLAAHVAPANGRQFLTILRSLPDFTVTDAREEELGRIHGNRDGFWLHHTVPALATITAVRRQAMPRPYQILSKSRDYRNYALGRWLREI
jgi:hypothetical protein